MDSEMDKTGVRRVAHVQPPSEAPPSVRESRLPEERVSTFPPSEKVEGACVAGDEMERTRLIHELSLVIREPGTPESTRTAGLTLIGWLARRMPGEAPHALGVEEARESERHLKTPRQVAR